jgi:hypothetical protein
MFKKKKTIESTLINTYFQFKDPIVSVQSIRFVADLQIWDKKGYQYICQLLEVLHGYNRFIKLVRYFYW